MGGNLLCSDFWEPVIAKVSKRLDGKKRAFLSKEGHLTLVQSVLSFFPTYYFVLILYSLWDGF